MNESNLSSISLRILGLNLECLDSRPIQFKNVIHIIYTDFLCLSSTIRQPINDGITIYWASDNVNLNHQFQFNHSSKYFI